MANTNLFEKYGIKEVADVTFYRIERKDETYESQREISASSILKGAIELKTVYPLENGVGAEDSIEAYVFNDASILTGVNYDCDDVPSEDNTVDITYSYTVTGKEAGTIDANFIIENGTASAEIPEGYVRTKTGEIVETTSDSVFEKDEILTVTVTYASIVAGEGGTHEYSYEEQILMLFAKNQNLISKMGTRFQFSQTDRESIFNGLAFSDEYTTAPNSTEKVVVLGIGNQLNSADYDAEEVMAAIKAIEYTVKAKAYDVTYKNYAELIVEDEMGYFDPTMVGTGYNKADWTITGNKDDITDSIIKNAVMWDEDKHKSINDAIDALRAKKAVLDVANDSAIAGLNSISGGYKVKSDTRSDDPYEYTYTPGSTTSGFALEAVIKALNEIALTAKAGSAVKVSATEHSNRAIYVRVDGNVDYAASAYIYILHNVNYKKLNTETAGVFEFVNNEGQKNYYKDDIFAGTEYLALVVIGNSGLIFKVGRHGVKKTEKIAWMVNENGYLTNAVCERVVENGLIHTGEITVNDESFEATCAVGSLKVRKTKKRVNRYVPVLFLDTLKVSTLEQTAESTDATGGRGNAKLITWDYGKEITLTLQDALYSPASMSAMLGSYEGNDFTKGVKDTKRIDRTEKCIAKRSFIVPAGNSKGVPSEGDATPQAVYIDLNTMQPYQDGAPIAEGEVYLKWTRSIAYGDNSLGNTIEISAEKFPGTYKVVGDTFARNKATGEDQRFQIVIPQAKMSSEQTITLEAEGDPTVFDMTLTVLRPDDGVMVKLIQYDVVENEEENDGSTMVKDTENLNLLDDAEMFKVNADEITDDGYIGATEY